MKKVITLISFLFIIVFCFAFQAKADSVAPQIFVSGLNFSVGTNNQISGQFTVWNSENSYYTDLSYSIRLFEGSDFNSLQLIDTDILPATFDIGPNQKITKSFTYQYPKDIVNDEYDIRAQVVTVKGTELGWEDQPIALRGSGNFLNIQNTLSRVLSNKDSAFPMMGIDVSPTDTVTAFLKVKNPGNAITVIPKIRIFKRQYNMALVQQYQDSPITFAKNETKDINLIMPKLNVPESYLAEVKFYSGSDQVSGIQYFRWVVEGVSGKILNITTSKDAYLAGENMKINVYYTGPADFSFIKGAQLETTVYDQNKNVVGKDLRIINMGPGLGSGPAVITIPLKKDLINAVVDAQLINNAQVLDEYKMTLTTSPQEIKQLQEKDKIKNIIFYSLLAIILLIIIFLFFKFKIISRVFNIKNYKK